MSKTLSTKGYGKMSSMSIAVLVGRLTRDAELKYTNNGQAICHFSLATGTRRKKGDQWEDEPSFWEIDLWGKQGESLNQYLTKGKLVGVEGAMRQDRWEHEGCTKVKVVIKADSVQLLSGVQSVFSGGGEKSESKPASQTEAFTDDIPF
jgi:single-strand DNA-binding protein